MRVKPFKPAKGLKSAHLQTLFPALFRKQKLLDAEIETFQLQDGDFVECYWHHKPQTGPSQSIVVLFHGLEGSFRSSYIQGMMHAFDRNGFSSVLMHFRGCSGKPNRLPRSYHSGDTGDAATWLSELKRRYPEASLFAVGYSLGGNMLLKLLGEQGVDSPLDGAVAISAPMLLEAGVKRMEKGFSRLYQSYLLRDLKASLEQKYRDHPMQSIIGVDRKEIKRIRSFYAFDDLYTAPVHGFSSAYDYYRRSSAKQYLKKIETPTLIIHALDDPFMTKEVIPNESEISKTVTLELYEHGGHVGFVGGSLFRPEYWLEERVVEYFQSISEREIS